MEKKTTAIFYANDGKDFYELSVFDEFIEIKHSDYPMVDFLLLIPILEWKEMNKFVNSEIKKG